MNKCCVKKIECEHATSYGVCKLSSAYDCKPIAEEYCECCKKPLLTGDMIYASDDTKFCTDCGGKLLTYDFELEAYLYLDESKDGYLDDELSDMELFYKEEVK
jgi:hypothetical protein